jgi:hypothetical protein
MKKNRTIEQIFRDDDKDESFIRMKDQEDGRLIGANTLNDDYVEYPKKEEYPKLNFIDIEKYGVVMNNE